MSDATATKPASPRPSRRRRRVWPWVLSLFLLANVVLLLLFRWDWLIPLVESQVKSATGRTVSLTHLHVRLGRTIRIVADDVQVLNPPDFPTDRQLGDRFATMDHLGIDVNVMDYIHSRAVVIPRISFDHPLVAAVATADGKTNYSFTPQHPGNAPPPAKSGAPGPKIGEIAVTDGHAHVVEPKLKADFNLAISTREASGERPAQLLVDGRGGYARQPITLAFVGGAILSLRDAKTPYPIDLKAENGPTHIRIVGTVEDPLAFQGTRIRLDLAGPDMSLLYPLTGIPIPQTPPYSIAGRLDYSKNAIRLDDFAGRVGSSDLEGAIAVDPHGAGAGDTATGGKPVVTADLRSKNIDITDLGGFIGAEPGRKDTPHQAPEQKQAVAKASSSDNLLPTTPINLPKLKAADIHLKYNGKHITNKYVPLDDIVVALDIVNGRITLHPLDFGVGTGSIASNIDLDPTGRDLHAGADIQFRRLDLTRILQATHAFQGQGTLGGQMEVNGTGNSLADLMAHGDGGFKLVLAGGGNLSALLVNIVGLEFGQAVLSALGVPKRTDLNCFIADLGLRQGIAKTNAFLLDTNEARVVGDGSLDFHNQTMDFALTTRSKHFSVGSLPGAINLDGKIKSPSIRPGAELVARTGAAIGLGILAFPLAVLPTIQFGVGNDNACSKAIAIEKQPLPPALKTTAAGTTPRVAPAAPARRTHGRR